MANLICLSTVDLSPQKSASNERYQALISLSQKSAPNSQHFIQIFGFAFKLVNFFIF